MKNFLNKYRNHLIIGGIVIFAAAAIILTLVFCINWGLSDTKRQEILANERFIEGVTLNGVDLSGKTYIEGKNEAFIIAKKKLRETSVHFRVGDTIYTLKGSEIGTFIDYESVLDEAMLLGRDDSVIINNKTKKDVKENGRNFELKIQVDRSVLESTIKDMSNTMNTSPRKARVSVDKVRTLANYSLTSQMSVVDENVGMTVDIEYLIDEIENAINKDCAERIITARWEEEAPEKSDAENISEHCALRGSYKVSISNLDENQKNNMWMAADALSGLIVEPGQKVSFLDIVGHFENQDMWKVAPVIGDTRIENENGGGAEYIASALYGALLSSDLQVDVIDHNTWAPDNIEPGLDVRLAEMTNKGLIFTNNTEYPIYIVVNCEGEKQNFAEVSIYGEPMEYSIYIIAKIDSTEAPSEEEEIVVDESQPEDYEEWTTLRKDEVSVQIWTQRVNVKTGENEGERIYLGKVIYPSMRGRKVIGKLPVVDEPTIEPTASVEVSDDPNNEENTDNPESPSPSSSPEENKTEGNEENQA